MRILLDECLPRKLKDRLVGHECRSVPELGFAGKKNGDLLALDEVQGFEVFLTMDKGVEYAQNLTGRRIAVVILRAASSRLVDLLPLVDSCLAKMRSIKAGQIVRIGE